MTLEVLGLGELVAPGARRHEQLAAAFLVQFSIERTRDAYSLGLRTWFSWCDLNAVDPLSVIRAHVDLYARHLEARGLKPRTVAQRLSILSSFYAYLTTTNGDYKCHYVTGDNGGLYAVDIPVSITGMDTEQRPIPGYPGYFATTDGTIIGRRGKPLVPAVSRNGYARVTFYDRADKRNHTASVHRLIAAAFLGDAAGHEVNHIDGCKLNNHLSNLEYVTSTANKRHARDVLGHWRGTRAAKAVLTEEQVRTMRALHAAGTTTVALGHDFGISQQSAWRVVHRRSWRHVA